MLLLYLYKLANPICLLTSDSHQKDLLTNVQTLSSLLELETESVLGVVLLW